VPFMLQGEEAFACAAADRPLPSIFSRLYAWTVNAEQHIFRAAEFLVWYPARLRA